MKSKRRKVTHARKRALERCGINLTPGDCDAIVAKIQANQLKVVERISGRFTTFEVEVEGKGMHAVYDKDLKVITTVKSPEMW